MSKIDVSGTISNTIVDFEQLKNNDYEYGFVEKAFDTIKDLFCWSNRVAAKTLFIEMMSDGSKTKEQFAQKFDALRELASATGKKEFTTDTNGNGDLTYKIGQFTLKTFSFELARGSLSLNIEGIDEDRSTENMSIQLEGEGKGLNESSVNVDIKPNISPIINGAGEGLRSQHVDIVLSSSTTVDELLKLKGETLLTAKKVVEMLLSKVESSKEGAYAKELLDKLESKQFSASLLRNHTDESAKQQFSTALFSTNGLPPQITISDIYVTTEQCVDMTTFDFYDKPISRTEGIFFAEKTLDNGDCSIASIGLNPGQVRTSLYVDNMIKDLIENG